MLDTLAFDGSWPDPSDLYTLSSFNFDEFSRPAIKSAINKLLAVDLWLNRDSFSIRYYALVELRNKLEKTLAEKSTKAQKELSTTEIKKEDKNNIVEYSEENTEILMQNL